MNQRVSSIENKEKKLIGRCADSALKQSFALARGTTCPICQEPSLSIQLTHFDPRAAKRSCSRALI